MLRDAFWPVYLVTVACGALAALHRGNWCLGRATFALVAASLAQSLCEDLTGEALVWWMHIAIDVPAFALIVMPPRNRWQSVMGGFLFAQIFLHCVWALEPTFARTHWLCAILIGFAKCATLLLWSGGPRVELLLSLPARAAVRLVLSAAARKLAR